MINCYNLKLDARVKVYSIFKFFILFKKISNLLFDDKQQKKTKNA